MLYLDCEVLLLEFFDKVLSGVEMLETFFCSLFVPVVACTVVVVDDSG